MDTDFFDRVNGNGNDDNNDNGILIATMMLMITIFATPMKIIMIITVDMLKLTH